MDKSIPIFKDYDFYNYIGNELDIIQEKQDTKVNFSGNPYVDNAILIVTILYNYYFKSNINPQDLTLKQIIEVFRFSHGNLKNGKEFTQINFLCNSAIYMLFPNNPLVQTSFRKSNATSLEDKPQSENLPSIKQEHIYVYYLSRFLKSIGSKESIIPCSYCGRDESFSFHEIDGYIFELLGKEKEKFNTGFAKIWYPLVGTIKGEAQAFHGYTEQPNICGLCLFLVHFLPQGVGLVKGKIALYQTNDIEISLAFIKENVEKIQDSYRISPDKKINIPGKGESYISLYVNLLEVFSKWKIEKHLQKFTLSSSLMLWMFTNSNTDVNATVEELPRTLLINLFGFYDNWKQETKKFLQNDEESGGNNSFINKMKKGDEYLGFYSKPSFDIANQEFFENYQRLVIERSDNILNFYKIISQTIISNYSRKEIDSILSANDFIRKRQIIITSVLESFENDLIDYNVLLEWIFKELNRKGYWPFDFYLHRGSNLEITDELNSNYENEFWSLIDIISRNYLYKNSLKGKFNKHSFFSDLKNQPFSTIMNELRDLSTNTPGLTWRKVIDIKKELHSIPGGKTITLMLFKIKVILNFKEKKFDKITFKNLKEISDIITLEENSLLSNGLIDILYNYINYRSNILGFGLKRSIQDLRYQLKENGRSLESFCSFLETKNIKTNDDEFIKSQSNSEIYFSGNSRDDFSWYAIKLQVINFLDQLQLLSNWENKLKETLRIKYENNI